LRANAAARSNPGLDTLRPKSYNASFLTANSFCWRSRRYSRIVLHPVAAPVPWPGFARPPRLTLLSHPTPRRATPLSPLDQAR